MFAAVTFTTLSASTSAGFALVAGALADWLFRGDSMTTAALPWLSRGNASGVQVLVTLGVVSGARVAGTLGAGWATARMGAEIAHALRLELYARVADRALPRTLAHHRGDLVARLRDDVNAIQSMLSYAVPGVVFTLLSSAMVASIIISIDPVVGAACLLGAPLAGFVVRLANRRFSKLWKGYGENAGLLDARIQEIVDVGDVVRSLGAERRMTERFAQVSDQARRVTYDLARTSALSKPLVSVSAAIGIAGVMVYWQFVEAPAPGAQASLLAAGAFLLRPLHDVAALFESVTGARWAIARVDEVLRAGAHGEAQKYTEERFACERFDARSISFDYDGTPCLRDITFRLERGRVLALVGPSGAGKTTLLKVVAGLLDPARGELCLDGRSAAELGSRHYRRHFGWVPQEALCLVDSVRENLRLGRPHASDAELHSALEAAGLWTTVAALPEGLDTVVTDNGAPFSVGQRQRLCIARALVPGAPVLVLDEPTAALDEAHAEALHATLESLRDQVAVLISTHRLSSVSRADWVLVMEQGRIVEQGTPAQLIAGGPAFRRLFAQAP